MEPLKIANLIPVLITYTKKYTTVEENVMNVFQNQFLFSVLELRANLHETKCILSSILIPHS